MSKPRFKWWGYVKAVIRSYPLHLSELNEIKQQHTTTLWRQNSGRGSGTRRTVEALALKRLSKDDQRELDAVEAAKERTRSQYQNGDERLKLIDMVFWKQSHSLTGAALAMYVSYETAKRWQQEFICLVAICMDLYHPE